MLPIVVFLLDGLADRAHAALGGRSGVEAATTPNLDRLCASGSCGVLYAVGPGRAPSSEVAHWSMLGYRPDEFPGRAVFEALGRGQEVDPEHVFAYAALRPAERVSLGPVSPPAATSEAMVADFLRTSREMIAAQRDVLLGFFGTDAPLPVSAPLPVVERPNVALVAPSMPPPPPSTEALRAQC